MRKIFGLLAAGLIVILAAGCSVNINVNVNQKTDKTAGQLLSVVMNSVQFPQTVELTDENIITDELGIDLSLVEEYAIVQQMLSVDVTEVIILIAKDGAAGQLEDVLEARKESLINDFAFYPNQVASAEGTEVGSVRNVVYLICHEDAYIAELKLIEEVED